VVHRNGHAGGTIAVELPAQEGRGVTKNRASSKNGHQSVTKAATPNGRRCKRHQTPAV